MKLHMKAFFVAILILRLSGAFLVEVAGQVTAGSASGSIRDQTGAVVPGVDITVRHLDTGAEYQVITNNEGRFAIPVLPVGKYGLTAELPGFKTSTAEFTVRLNERTTLAIDLQVGEATEKVEVLGAAEPVETTSTQISEAFSTREILDLPTASRGVNNLALLAPNTVDINSSGLTGGQLLSQQSTPVGGAVGAIGGNRARNNSFTVDGVDNNDPITTGPQLTVIQDAVQEFSVLKNSFDSEYGQSAGGQFNIVTRTGTNEFHGNAFWYNENRHLNGTDALAQNAIRNGLINEKRRFDQNRVGATLGGPIVRDKLFFFGGYEYETIGAGSSSSSFTFPTQQGYDLLSTLGPGVTRDGTQGQVSPFVLGFVREFGLTAPEANIAPSQFPIVLGTPIPVGSVSRTIPSFATNHRFLGNIDWNPGPTDDVHFRFNSDRGPNGVVPGVPKAELNANREIDNQLVSAAWVHTFSPTVLNEARIAYHRQRTGLNIADPAASNIPDVQVAEIALQIGPSGPAGSFNHIYQLLNNTSWQASKHLVKFGFDIRNNIVSDIGFVAPRGNYIWVNLEELLLDLPPTQFGLKGLGGPTRALNNYSLNFFGQDEYRLHPRLTMNYGLRYEFNSLPRDLGVQERQSIADVPGVIEFDRPRVEKNNLAPRLGFAWDIFGNGSTALRGSYGITYNAIFGAFVGGGTLPSALQQVFITNSCLPNCPIPVPTSSFLERGGVPSTLIPFDSPAQARSATQSFVPDLERPYMQNFTLSLERELFEGWTTTLRYLRTKGTHLSVQARLNAGIVPPRDAFLPTWFNQSEVPSQATLDTLPTVNDFLARVVRPFDQFGFAGSTLTTHLPIGNSEYNSGSVAIERRFTSGFTFEANYTWSRLIDTSTNEFFNSFINPRRPQDWRDLDNERGLSVLDVPHRFVLHYLWDLPWFRGGDGILPLLLGGWTTSGVYSAQSGQPWTPLSQANSLGNGDVQVQRALINPNGTSETGTRSTPILNSSGRTVGYLANDPNARFVQAGVGVFPTAGRNILRAPGINNFDFVASKDFGFGEDRRIQFQAQFFNLFNHPQFTGANLLAVDPGLGVNYAFVGSAGFNDIERAGGTGGARIIQLVLRLFY